MRVAPLLICSLAVLGACAPLKSHQGYVIDAELVNSVQPGVDNRDSVAKVLGEPSYRGQFGANPSWYYISRDSQNFAFNAPHPTNQTTVEITFDAKGTVQAVHRGNLTEVAAIDPYGKTTPTLGRKRTLLQDLFGNIGTVGAAGIGGGGAGQGGGGTTTRP